MFQPLKKYGSSGWLRGAVVKKSADGDSLSITLGQDVMDKYGYKGDGIRMRVNIGSGTDAGKIVLIPMKGGYKLCRDEHGKGRIRFKNPQAVRLFMNGHLRVMCTVLPWADEPQWPEGKAILLCGNNRG